MANDTDLAAVLEIFSRYGFRKTSMDNVAAAVGISRQALYKRFDSKEAIFHWAANALLEQSLDSALAALSNDSVAPNDRLLDALFAWTGQYVDLLRASPHSSEIISMAGAETSDLSAKAEQKISRSITALLRETRSELAADAARDQAFALYCASKGLMYTAESSAAYRKSMRRVIRAIVGP